MFILDKIMRFLQVTKDVELAKELGMKNSATIGNWRSRGKVPPAVIREWSLKFSKPIEWFTEIDELESSGFATVKVFNRLSCGQGVEPGSYEEIGVVMVPAKYDKPHIIMVKTHGRSMEPTIKEGGYIGIDMSDRHVISGEMYAVHSQIEGSVVKRVMVHDDSLTLVSDNTNFKPTEVKDVPDYFIIGRVKLVVNEY